MGLEQRICESNVLAHVEKFAVFGKPAAVKNVKAANVAICSIRNDHCAAAKLKSLICLQNFLKPCRAAEPVYRNNTFVPLQICHQDGSTVVSTICVVFVAVRSAAQGQALHLLA